MSTPIAAPQPRRAQRRKYLDASVLPVEQALLARAAVLEAEAREVTETREQTLGAAVKLLASQEFRALAEELHWH